MSTSQAILGSSAICDLRGRSQSISHSSKNSIKQVLQAVPRSQALKAHSPVVRRLHTNLRVSHHLYPKRFVSILEDSCVWCFYECDENITKWWWVMLIYIHVPFCFKLSLMWIISGKITFTSKPFSLPCCSHAVTCELLTQKFLQVYKILASDMLMDVIRIPRTYDGLCWLPSDTLLYQVIDAKSIWPNNILLWLHQTSWNCWNCCHIEKHYKCGHRKAHNPESRNFWPLECTYADILIVQRLRLYLAHNIIQLHHQTSNCWNYCHIENHYICGTAFKGSEFRIKNFLHSNIVFMPTLSSCRWCLELNPKTLPPLPRTSRRN